MRKSKPLLVLCLTVILSLSCPKTLASDLPAGLSPEAPVSGGPVNFFCTDKTGAQKIAVAFRENKDCHNQVSKAAGGPDWVLVFIVGFVALSGGYLIGSGSR